MAGATKPHDDLKLHLHVLGSDHEISARARIGPTKLLEVLPLAREIAGGLTAISAEHVRAEGKEISCRRGCTWCCHQLVPIAPAEAVRLAEVVEAMPREQRREVKRRFERAVQRLESAGILESARPRGTAALRSTASTEADRWEDASRRYYQLDIACPFLEGESCGIYAERPMVCREYQVTTPASLCEALAPELQAAPRPVRMSEVTCDLTNELLEREDMLLPLPLSLEWASVHGAAFQLEGDGEEMAMALVQCIQAADDVESR